MGVGKSMIAKELGTNLNIPIIDTDIEIEKSEKNSINNLFNIYGERYFRKLESKFIRNIDTKTKKIIACGGGLPIFHENMKYINKNGISIYLKGEVDFIYSRLKREKENRPLIQILSNKDLKVFIKNQLDKREKVYKKAKYIIEITDKKEQDILREISSLILTF